jgi:hypothetical protein
VTTSGSYTFELDNSNIVLESFDRIGFRPIMLTREHLSSARRSLNLELQSWSNRGMPLLWTVDLQTINLVAGTATYNVPAETVTILDVYIENGTTDRIMTSISRSDYAAQPDKTTQGYPSVFWFDRLSPTPTITFWQVPDSALTYQVKYYRVRRIQDAAITSGQTADIPYLFMDALCAGLAARLARKYAPTMVADMKAEAQMAFNDALEENIERVQTFITPDLSSYYRVM